MIVYSRQENTNQLADLNIGKFSFNLFRKSLDFPELLSDFNQIIIFEIIHNVFTGLIYSKYYHWRRTLYLQNLFISFFMETMWPVLSVVSLTLWNLLWTWMYLLLSYSSLIKQIKITTQIKLTDFPDKKSIYRASPKKVNYSFTGSL